MRKRHLIFNRLSKRVAVLALVPVLLLGSYLWLWPQKAHAQTDTFTTSGTWNVPAGVSSAVFEAWGGGGTGGPATNGGGTTLGGGGAGGQYANKTASGLIQGNGYTITVGAVTNGQSIGAIAGSDSFVTNPSSTIILEAKGGAGGGANGVGANGSITGGIGDVVSAGGNGSSGSGSVSGAGGGGAGSSGTGGNASGTTGGSGTSANGGNGGAGRSTTGPGSAGSNYGGGGGGALKLSGGTQNGGNGAAGLVTVTYTVNSAPNAPTVVAPSSGSTIISTTPTLQMSSTDPEGDNVKYKVLIYNTTASSGGNCSGSLLETGDQTSSGTGWNNGTTAYASAATASYTVQATLTRGNGYCWQAQAIDPSGSNTFGSLDTAATFTVNASPSAPTLTAPAAGATNVSLTPTFTFNDTDPDGDDIQFKINLFQSDCSTTVSTYDMASGQTGWTPTFNGIAGSGLSFTSATAGSGVTFTPSSSLSASTTYCWSVSAKDPAGTNTYTTSGTQSFTTSAVTQVNIGGGTNITGGTNIQ